MAPGVKPVALIISWAPTPPPLSEQLIFVPLQEPDRRSTTASNPEEGVTVIVWLDEVAAKEYHTSRAVALVNPSQVMPGMASVAHVTLPVVAPPQVGEAYTVKGTAPEQSSLPGGEHCPQIKRLAGL